MGLCMLLLHIYFLLSSNFHWAGGMVRWLGALAAITEDLNALPRSHIGQFTAAC